MEIEFLSPEVDIDPENDNVDVLLRRLRWLRRLLWWLRLWQRRLRLLRCRSRSTSRLTTW